MAYEGPIETAEEDRACGAHSGIPACCIVFYVNVWKARTPLWEGLYHEALGLTFRHVPCPPCFRAGNVVEIRRCSCRPLS